jgi:uncharacterized protein (DUF169 family)
MKNSRNWACRHDPRKPARNTRNALEEIDDMVDLRQVEQGLHEFLRLEHYPLAIKMARSEADIPAKTRRPHQDMHLQMATCQAISAARRYGWAMALGREDMCCAPGIAALGLEPSIGFYTEGNLCEGMYTETAEAGKASEAAVDRFDYGDYQYVVMAPLNRATFEPDVLLIYGNSAQVMRLVQAALYKSGGKLTSSFGGRLDCADIIVTTMKTQECQVILPCTGDRFFAQTQDHEMAFTIPGSKIAEVMEGLQQTHRHGVRYPATPFLMYQGKFPPKYDQLLNLWEEQKQEG